jgi:hypothetical protein
MCVSFTFILTELATNNRSLIGCGINQTITSKISLATSFIEYFVTAIGYIITSWQLHRPRGRFLVFLCVNTISWLFMAIVTLTLLTFNILVHLDVISTDLVIFQWVRITLRLGELILT